MVFLCCWSNLTPPIWQAEWLLVVRCSFWWFLVVFGWWVLVVPGGSLWFLVGFGVSWWFTLLLSEHSICHNKTRYIDATFNHHHSHHHCYHRSVRQSEKYPHKAQSRLNCCFNFQLGKMPKSHFELEFPPAQWREAILLSNFCAAIRIMMPLLSPMGSVESIERLCLWQWSRLRWLQRLWRWRVCGALTYMIVIRQ